MSAAGRPQSSLQGGIHGVFQGMPLAEGQLDDGALLDFLLAASQVALCASMHALPKGVKHTGVRE